MKLQDLTEKLPALAGGLGLLLLVAGLGTYLVTNDFDRVVIVLLGFGVALLLATASYYPQQLAAVLKGRSTRYGSNTLAMIAIFIAIVALFNFLSVKRSYRWDLTENSQYSLSQQSIALLGRLEEPVKITSFQPQGPEQEKMEDLLKEYRRYSDKIDYQFVDPVLKPAVAREFRIQGYPTTVLEYKGKRQEVLASTEQEVTSAILKLSRSKAVKVYFLTGHGEASIDGYDRGDASQVKAALEADSYEVIPLTLATSGSVPDDAAVLVVAGPKSPLLENEKKAIKEHLDRGGKALMMLEGRGPDSLNDIVKDWGIEVGTGVVIDPASSLSGQPQMPVVLRYGQSPITNDLMRTRQMTMLPLATSVTPAQQPPQGVAVSKLMETTDRAWLETDSRTAKYDEGVDAKGPLSLAVAVQSDDSTAVPSTQGAEQQGENPGDKKAKTRLVVIGDADFATNELVGEAALGNRDLFLNSIGWLSEEEDMITIRAKEPTMRSVFLKNTEMNFIFYSSVMFLPLIVLAIGGMVWWNRR